MVELKQAIADKSDVPADRQRLIYAGQSFTQPSLTVMLIGSYAGRVLKVHLQLLW